MESLLATSLSQTLQRGAIPKRRAERTEHTNQAVHERSHTNALLTQAVTRLKGTRDTGHRERSSDDNNHSAKFNALTQSISTPGHSVPRRPKQTDRLLGFVRVSVHQFDQDTQHMELYIPNKQITAHIHCHRTWERQQPHWKTIEKGARNSTAIFTRSIKEHDAKQHQLHDKRTADLTILRTKTHDRTQ